MCLCLICFTSCTTRSNDVLKYGDFFGNRYYIKSTLEMFPTLLKDSWQVDGYDFWYQNLFWEDCYIFLNLQFQNETDYNDELSRVLAIEGSYYQSEDRFAEDLEHFYYPAYVLRNDSLTKEYILAISEENRIIYVFLQKAPKDVIQFPNDYLPKSY